MMVTFISQDPCGQCGYLRTGVMLPLMRINKRSMRSQGKHLIVLPGRCPECQAESPCSPSLRWVLEPASAAKIEAYRLRKWPELASEVSAPSIPGGGR